MINRTCARCLKQELEETDLAFFKKGDKVRPMFNMEQAIPVFGMGAVRLIWIDGYAVPLEECFCEPCILEMARKHKVKKKERKPRVKIGKA